MGSLVGIDPGRTTNEAPGVVASVTVTPVAAQPPVYFSTSTGTSPDGTEYVYGYFSTTIAGIGAQVTSAIISTIPPAEASTTTPPPTSSSNSISAGQARSANPLGGPSALTQISATPSPNPPSSTAPSSALDSGSPSSSSTFADASAQASNSSSSSPATQVSSSSSNTGLIAGVGVLAGLLVIALLAIAFLLFKRRRQANPRGEYAQGHFDKSGDNDPALESEIVALKSNLHEKDAQLRESQALLLNHNRKTGPSKLDDKQVHAQFAILSQSINDWVVTHFKKMRPNPAPAADVAAILRRTIPNYARLLQDPRTKFIVIRALVAEALVEGFNTGELLGSEDFSHFRNTISANASPAESNEWRALTLSLLHNSSAYNADKQSSIEEITQKIDNMTSVLGSLEVSNNTRHQHLQRVVESASNLALTLGRERSHYKVEMPADRTFDSQVMEDVMQEARANQLEGRAVQGFVFPLVTRYGDENGMGYERGLVISKAQVLV